MIHKCFFVDMLSLGLENDSNEESFPLHFPLILENWLGYARLFLSPSSFNYLYSLFINVRSYNTLFAIFFVLYYNVRDRAKEIRNTKMLIVVMCGSWLTTSSVKRIGSEAHKVTKKKMYTHIHIHKYRKKVKKNKD